MLSDGLERRALRAPTFFAGALLLMAAMASPAAHAHDIHPPTLRGEPVAPWPDDRPESHDVVVPVVLTVSAAGVVEAVVIETSVSTTFDRAAAAAARTWRYEPAMRDGKPVATKIRAAVRFVAPREGDTTANAEGRPASHASPSSAGPSGAARSIVVDRPQSVTVRGTAPPRSASETTRGREVIGASPHRTASDLLRLAPGVSISQHSGEGKAHQIFLRGFDSAHGQDVEIWVGGLPVNEVSNIHGQGYADLHFAMPEVVKEIQSTPGTYDPRQGDFAVAGTIRMKLGYSEPGITAKGTLGSFGTRRVFLAYHPKDTSDETFAAFERHSTDGFGPNRAAERGSLVAQTNQDFGDGIALRILGTSYSGRFDSAGVLRARDIERGLVDRFATYDSRQGGASSRTQLLIELHKDDEGARWSIAPFVSFRSLALRQNFTGYLLEKKDGDNVQQLHDAITAGATASYRKLTPIFSERDAFEAGLYARNDWIEQSQRRLSSANDAPILGAGAIDAKIRATNIAGYLDASIFPLPRLALRGGARVDVLSYAARDALPSLGSSGAERSAQGAHLGKKLTVDVLVVPKLRALASYGEGFRSPQARSLSNGERSPFTEVKSYELGLRYGEAGRLQGSLAAFHTDLSQDLAFDPETARNERTPGTARNGVALEMVVRPASWLVTSASATLTRATFTESDLRFTRGDLLPYVPQLVVRTDTMVKRELTKVGTRSLEGRIGYGIEGLARRPLPYGESGQNVFLVDATAGLRLREFELGVDVFNVFDARWFDGELVYASSFDRGGPAHLVPQKHVTVGAPRTVFLSLALYI